MIGQFGLQRQAKFALLVGVAAERTETKAQPKPNRQPKPPPQISPPYAFAPTSAAIVPHSVAVAQMTIS
jgi:hypothetical protein